MRKFLAFISLIAAILLPSEANAQSADTLAAGSQGTVYPEKDGQRLECKAMIEMPKGYISGICILVNEADTIKGAIINEFGITALGFSYSTSDDKVRLVNVNTMLDKWYIRNVLSKDIRNLLHALKQGKTEFVDEKYHITYTLSPMDSTTEDEE